MTERIAHDYKQGLSRLVLLPSAGGVFEVSLDGDLLHSKKATGAFPEEEEIVAAVGKALHQAD